MKRAEALRRLRAGLPLRAADAVPNQVKAADISQPMAKAAALLVDRSNRPGGQQVIFPPSEFLQPLP